MSSSAAAFDEGWDAGMLFGAQVTFNWGKGLAQCLIALWRVVWFDIPCMIVTVHNAALFISGDYEHRVKLKQSLAHPSLIDACGPSAQLASRGSGAMSSTTAYVGCRFALSSCCAVVFMCTRCSRGRCGSRLWSWPHTLAEFYILFDVFDLRQLICPNDALYLPRVMQYDYAMIMISCRSHSRGLPDSLCLLVLTIHEQNINTTSGYQLYYTRPFFSDTSCGRGRGGSRLQP